jgi:hypothetical protein
MTSNMHTNHPGRAEMLELLRQRASGSTPKDVQQTAMGRWPTCIVGPGSKDAQQTPMGRWPSCIAQV